MLSPPVRVCFVCSGNICRSPTAEVVFTAVAADAGLADLVEVSSAGTGSWHAGDDMDARSRRTLVEGGYSVAAARGPAVRPARLRELRPRRRARHRPLERPVVARRRDARPGGRAGEDRPAPDLRPEARPGRGSRRPRSRTTATAAGSPRCWSRSNAAAPRCSTASPTRSRPAAGYSDSSGLVRMRSAMPERTDAAAAQPGLRSACAAKRVVNSGPRSSRGWAATISASSGSGQAAGS